MTQIDEPIVVENRSEVKRIEFPQGLTPVFLLAKDETGREFAFKFDSAAIPSDSASLALPKPQEEDTQ